MKEYWPWTAVAIVALMIPAYFLMTPDRPQEHQGPLTRIVFGVETSLLPCLVWISENRGYFRDEGLDVSIIEFDSGRAALAEMLDGKVQRLDLATVAQTAVMSYGFRRGNFGIVGTMAYSEDDVKILANRDKGIKAAGELRGKRVGVTLRSRGHYFLSLLLNHHGLAYSDVEIVDFRASELAQAISDGRVDAVSTWEPHLTNGRKLLGENGLVLSGKGLFREEFYFVVKEDFAKNHRESLKGFLRAIMKAETFVQENRTEAIGIVARRLNLDRDFVASIWSDFQYRLVIDQSVLVTLEIEARWAIKNKLVEETKVPDYSELIYFDLLEALRPASVTIIR
jgi:NitT/TauT family transport system substrate-binding protein